MPVPTATPENVLAWSQPKTGQFFALDRWDDRRGADLARTVDRPWGVGGPAPSAVEEDPVADLVREAVRAASSAIWALDAQARDVARRFRTRPGAHAQQGLTHLVDSTQTLLKLAAMAAAIAGVDLRVLSDEHGRASEATDQVVASLIRHQLTADWDALADTLDAEFTRALAGWRRVFRALDAPHDPGPMGQAA